MVHQRATCNSMQHMTDLACKIATAICYVFPRAPCAQTERHGYTTTCYKSVGSAYDLHLWNPRAVNHRHRLGNGLVCLTICSTFEWPATKGLRNWQPQTLAHNQGHIQQQLLMSTTKDIQTKVTRRYQDYKTRCEDPLQGSEGQGLLKNCISNKKGSQSINNKLQCDAKLTTNEDPHRDRTIRNC